MNKRPTRCSGIAGSVGLALLTLAISHPSAHAANSARDAYEAGRNAPVKATRESYFAQGIELAKARLASKPDDAEGLYWLAVNMGAAALERGKMTALPMIPNMEALLLRLDQVDARYEQAGAARVLGRLYHQAPAIISVGSNKKAGQFLARAVSLAPGHPGNLAFAADFLVSHGDKAVARSYAAKSLAALSGRALTPEEKEWVALARDVMEDTQ